MQDATTLIETLEGGLAVDDSQSENGSYEITRVENRAINVEEGRMIFGLFKKKREPARVEPVSSDPSPAVKRVRLPFTRDCAAEAVEALGYLKPSAIDSIASMIEGVLVNHSKSITTDYRRTGEQISNEEKKALGIRKNAFMNQQALADLTDKGLAKPLDAHELTLRRALFSTQRIKTIRQGWDRGIDEFEHSSFDRQCPACDVLDKKITSGAYAHIFPPRGCTCETGRYGLSIHIDFIEQLVREERAAGRLK